MTHERNPRPIAVSRERKDWRTPAVRSVIPSRRTAGGPISNGFQEDAVYSLS